ncbi:MAG: patatin-like phospholipase family protein [Deltaproteobacteria bacterium]|nr:patatin-like phospholipase family protein [Deltaproteobacteria bacterium]
MNVSGLEITLREWLGAGPFALGLSSGFFGFFAHAGLISALEKEGLFPARVAGSSAGALVGTLWTARLSARAISDRLLSLERKEFWDPFPGPGLLRGRRFRRMLESLLPVRDFSDCRWPAAISVLDVAARRVHVLDSGPLAPAIHASCAVPFLFHPVWIGGRAYLDGGVVDRHGLAGIPDGARLLYHHLASRSPWRRKNSPALMLPERPETVSLVIEGLPRSGPFRLENGTRAYALARAAARRALDEPIVDGVVRVTAEDCQL